MKINKTFFEEVFHFDLDSIVDDRGSLSRFYCKKIIKNIGVKFDVKQISFVTNNKKHTLRGMHFQKHPNPEQKMIICLKGSIWDVIVDIRKKSKTYGKWFSIELSKEKQNCLYVPAGFAHGYLTMTAETQILYLMDEYYSSKDSVGINWDDPDLQINWPYVPKKISLKDKELPRLINL